MSVKRKVLSVYIGRFQPLHKGHEEVIKRAMETSDHLAIIIGSARGPSTVKNPFSSDQRRIMISNMMWNEKIPMPSYSISEVQDYPYNDSQWIASVQASVMRVAEDLENEKGELPIIKIVGSDRDESTWYLNVFPGYQLDLSEPYPDGGNMNATELRHRLFSEHLSSSQIDAVRFPELSETTLAYIRFWMDRFPANYTNLVEEEKCIRDYKKRWEAAPYAPTFVTADAVVIQSGHVLVVERGQRPGKGLWALPGGFVNQNERIKNAVVRELIEETGLKLQEKVLLGSIVDMEIFDKPDRSLRGRTITHAAVIKLDDTKPLPRVKGQNVPVYESGGEEIVETAKAFWLPLAEATRHPERWFEDHLSIINWAMTTK